MKWNENEIIPSIYQLCRFAREHSSTCKSKLHSTATDYISTYKSHFLKPQKTWSFTGKHYWALFYIYAKFPEATRGLVPISYRGTTGLDTIRLREALQGNFLHVRIIRVSHNRPSTFQSQRRATVHTLYFSTLPQATTGLVSVSYSETLLNSYLHTILSLTSYNRHIAEHLQRSATEYISTYKTQFHKPQQT
jgi:hypothetical protein